MDKILVSESLYNAAVARRNDIDSKLHAGGSLFGSVLWLLGKNDYGVYTHYVSLREAGGCDLLPGIIRKELESAYARLNMVGAKGPYCFMYISATVNALAITEYDMGAGLWNHKNTPFISLTMSEFRAYTATEDFAFDADVVHNQEVGIVSDTYGQPVPKKQPTRKSSVKRTKTTKKSIKGSKDKSHGNKGKGKGKGSKVKDDRRKVRPSHRAA